MAWWWSSLPPAHWPLSTCRHHNTTRMEWGVHNSYARQPVPWFGNKAQPSFTEQYNCGARLFEIDAYAWTLGWVVAHVPLVDQSSHVFTVRDAVCTLRKLGADNVMLLDVKNAACKSIASELRACQDVGPLTVLVDVTCTGYSNIACARQLRSSKATANTSLLFRGISFWWLSHDCRTNATSRGASCAEFTEPLETSVAHIPILAECKHCTRSQCLHAMRAHKAPVTYVQVKSV